MDSTSSSHVSEKDFDPVSVLGLGAYGKVILVRKIGGIDNGVMYAMKTLKKKEIIKLN